MNNEFDLAIIGAGTGGYAAAIRASELELKVALIEKDKIGGVCLHRGCIPTKALLHVADLVDDMRRADEFGVKSTEPSLDWQKVMEAKQATVDRLYQGLQSLIKGRKIKVVNGVASLSEPGQISVSDTAAPFAITASAVIIATGSAPKSLGLTIDGTHIITSDNALNLESPPSSVVILGGGAVGLEFASMWRSFGVTVTIIELMPHILPAEDEEIALHLTQALTNRGIDIKSDAKFEDAAIREDGVSVSYSERGRLQTIAAEKLMVAVGREAVSNDLGLEKWGIKLKKGFIDVDSHLQTTVPKTFAVGDVIDTPQLAHVAFAEGIYVAEQTAGLTSTPPNYDQIPRCIYTSPEVAAVGLTEKQAIERGFSVRSSSFPYQANSKANILHQAVGVCKIVAAKDGPILGIHLVGPRVTELIAEAMLVTNWEGLPEDLAALIHPHPTLSESIGEAAMRLVGKPLHVGG